MHCSQSDPTVRNVAFSRNESWPFGTGGGMHCESSSPSLVDVTLVGSVGTCTGGGTLCHGGAPTLTRVAFAQNTNADQGGGMCCHGGYPALEEVVFWGNSASFGGALHLSCDAPPPGLPVLNRVAVAHNEVFTGEGAVCCFRNVLMKNTIAVLNAGRMTFGGETSTLSCCNVFGNEGDDWIGDLAPQLGVSDSIPEDPVFCVEEEPDGPYRLRENSPCAPFSPLNAECDLIGALGVDCGVTAAVETSCGSINAMYRR